MGRRASDIFACQSEQPTFSFENQCPYLNDQQGLDTEASQNKDTGGEEGQQER